MRCSGLWRLLRTAAGGLGPAVHGAGKPGRVPRAALGSLPVFAMSVSVLFRVFLSESPYGEIYLKNDDLLCSNCSLMEVVFQALK